MKQMNETDKRSEKTNFVYQADEPLMVNHYFESEVLLKTLSLLEKVMEAFFVEPKRVV